jgi:dCMP deaminase
MNWIEYFFKIVDVIKLKSKDTSTKVGCIIVGPNNEIISTGFNGLPRGVMETEHRTEQRPTKYFYTEHAERNAIYLAARRGVPIDGASMYIQWFPCADCARAIIQSGIKSVYIDKNYYDPKSPTAADKRWKDSFDASLAMLNEANIKIIII